MCSECDNKLEISDRNRAVFYPVWVVAVCLSIILPSILRLFKLLLLIVGFIIASPLFLIEVAYEIAKKNSKASFSYSSFLKDNEESKYFDCFYEVWHEFKNGSL